VEPLLVEDVVNLTVAAAEKQAVPAGDLALGQGARALCPAAEQALLAAPGPVVVVVEEAVTEGVLGQAVEPAARKMSPASPLLARRHWVRQETTSLDYRIYVRFLRD
jgi:hypothetical protein